MTAEIIIEQYKICNLTAFGSKEERGCRRKHPIPLSGKRLGKGTVAPGLYSGSRYHVKM